MSAIKGDFIGFTFNGIHSSELGLMRVSDGSRYTEELLPNFQDKTVQIPGADGTYYYGSYYTQKPFNLSVVFDDMSEEQFIKLKEVFGDKKIHDLIFDEWPYKIYRVKSTGAPNLKYICFNKGVDEFDRDFNKDNKITTKEELYSVNTKPLFGRVYKGEGQLNFICYNPYAKSRYKYLDEYSLKTVPEWGSLDSSAASKVNYNLYDWNDTIKLKRSNAIGTYNNGSYQIDTVNSSGVMIYNPGNLPTDFILTFVLTGTSFNGGTFSLNSEKRLTLDSFDLASGDVGFRINTKLNLIEGIKQGQGNNYDISGMIYNEYISEGNFFKLPVTSDLEFMLFSPALSGVNVNASKIEYNYLFY